MAAVLSPLTDEQKSRLQAAKRYCMEQSVKHVMEQQELETKHIMNTHSGSIQSQQVTHFNYRMYQHWTNFLILISHRGRPTWRYESTFTTLFIKKFNPVLNKNYLPNYILRFFENWEIFWKLRDSLKIERFFQNWEIFSKFTQFFLKL